VWQPSANGIQEHSGQPQREVLPFDRLSLNHNQMEQLRQMDIDEFTENTASTLVNNKAKYTFTANIDDNMIKQHVKHHISEAMKFGLELEDSICDYIEHTANFLGWGHLEKSDSRTASILSDPNLAEEDKLKLIKEMCATA
jgi:hypothetical protein